MLGEAKPRKIRLEFEGIVVVVREVAKRGRAERKRENIVCVRGGEGTDVLG